MKWLVYFVKEESKNTDKQKNQDLKCDIALVFFSQRLDLIDIYNLLLVKLSLNVHKAVTFCQCYVPPIVY